MVRKVKKYKAGSYSDANVKPDQTIKIVGYQGNDGSLYFWCHRKRKKLWQTAWHCYDVITDR